MGVFSGGVLSGSSGSDGSSGVTSVNNQTGILTFTSPDGSISINASGGTIAIQAAGIAGGVNSLNGLTGILSLANADGVSWSASGTTITPSLGNITPTSVISSGSGSFNSMTIGTLSGILLGTSGVVSVATAGTDYLSPFGSQTAKTFYAAPNASSGTPSFRLIVASDIPTLNQNTTGNAGTATALQTARAINGVNFDGTALITVTAAAGTLTGTTLNSTVVTSSLTSVGSQAQALNMNTHQINAVVDPTSAQDAATKNYVDMAVAAIDSKAPVQVATTMALAASTYNNGSSGVGATITLTTAAVLILDGYTPALGDRLLIQNQASALQNGIYTVTTLGTITVSAVLTRTLDFDQPGDGINGAAVFVLNGATNGNNFFMCTTSGTITFGTTAINWFNFKGAVYSADGTTLTLSGSTFSLNSTFQATLTTLTGTQTLTNKRIAKRTVTAADATSVTPNSDNADITYQSNTQALGTLTINADGGTPTNGQSWLFKIKSTNVQTFSWNAVFIGGTVALPTVTTGGGKIDNLAFFFDTVNSKWQFTGQALGF